MIKEIFRKYLEISSLKDLKESPSPSKNYFVEQVKTKDFQLNNFLYKQIGSKYYWTDRLIWSDQEWIKYISNKNFLTIILKHKSELVGYCELINHSEKSEVEIAYFGILEEYFGKKLGSFMLSEAIKKSFMMGAKRVWLHTCSLDHENALSNYLARGMKIYKSEVLRKESA